MPDEVTVSSSRFYPNEDRNRDILELAGEHSDLAVRIGALMDAEKHKEVLDAIDSVSAAKDTPYFRLAYGIALNLKGYESLKQGRIEEAVSDFIGAREHVDGCENAFDAQEWNNEVNAYRFIVRKHQGDCAYDLAERCYHSGDVEGYSANLEEMERHYKEAVELYEETLRSVKSCFNNTAVATYINLSNLYVLWARATAGTIDGMALTMSLVTGNRSQHEKVEKAWNLINKGIDFQDTVTQLTKSLGDPQYDATIARIREQAAEIYQRIKLFHDVTQGRMPGT